MTSPDTTPRYGSGGYVTNEVISLKLEHLEGTVSTLANNLVAELRELRREAVRRDVYDEQRRADQAELAQVKEELKEARQRKWAVWLAVTAAIIALGRDLLSGLLSAAT